MTEAEHWLPVVGYEGFYEVSDLGRVRSLRSGTRWGSGTCPRPRPLILKPHWKDDTYLHVDLKKDGVHKQPRLHKLVLTAFVGPRPAGLEGAHGNGDKSNNRLDNLRWATSLENKEDMARHGARLFGDAHPRSVVTSEIARRIKADSRASRVIAAEIGVCSSTVRKIKQGRLWTHV